MEKNNDMVEFLKKLSQHEQQTNSYLNEIKILISTIKKEDGLKIINFFTYTTNISHDKDKENMIIGSYHIQNLGNKPITNPYICLKLSANSPFQFSGKYINKKSYLSQKINDAWERFNEQSDKEEYWLKPVGKEVIAPFQVISFPNFQVRWLSKESYSGTISGFTYCDQNQEGTPSLNQISISGN